MQSKWFHAYANKANWYRRKTDYVDNIRGWMTNANSFYLKKQGDRDSTYYGLSLAYDNGSTYVSQMMWRGKAAASFTQGLGFTYDDANRLKNSTGVGGYADTESDISYDKNGNIKFLTRSGSAVDQLTYNYATGNQLSSVSDASGNSTGVKGGANSYGYDAGGNMTSDGNRGATLTYNYLNLPKTVAVGGKTLAYDYDAAGNKHKYVSDTLTVKYAGIFEYDANNVLKRIGTAEGQVVPGGDTLRFDYFLKDHLGNNRVVFDERGKTLQLNDYYPFGLSIDRNSPVTTPAARNGVNRYLYNEKELQVGTGYLDYGARMYMPEIGRWGVVDPMAEKNNDLTGYSYAVNNPVLFTDPFGLDTVNANTNRPVMQGDVVNFANGTNATQSVNEATVRGQSNNSQSAGMNMVLPGSFSPTFAPGSTPTTIPRAAPLLIPVAYAGLIAYLRGPSAIEEIARLLERMGVSSDVLRGPEVRNYHIPPQVDELPGFPGSRKVPNKNRRARWVSRDGEILEWDYKRGEVEVYNKTGKTHKGAADPNTGKMRPNSADPKRTTNN